jgi:antitoxin ParD1/3/4
VKRKVEAGEYESASDVVVEALYLLAARDRLLEGEREELRREIQIGIARCERGEVVDTDEVFAGLRERMRAGNVPVK